MLQPSNRVRKVGSIGMPIDGVEMRIVDDNGKKVPVATPVKSRSADTM